jgi:hypothetical protein
MVSHSSSVTSSLAMFSCYPVNGFVRLTKAHLRHPTPRPGCSPEVGTGTPRARHDSHDPRHLQPLPTVCGGSSRKRDGRCARLTHADTASTRETPNVSNTSCHSG